MRVPLISALLASLLLAACSPGDPVVQTPSPEPSSTASATPEPGDATPDPTPTVTPASSATPSPSPTPFPSGTPRPSTTPRPSSTPTPSPTATPGVLASIAISPSSLELDEDGDTGQLTVIARDGNGQTISTSGLSFTWSTSNEDKVTVNSSGKVTAQDDDGSARITVRESSKGLSATALVEIDDGSSGGGGGGGGDDDDDPLEDLDADLTAFQGLGAGEFMINSSDSYLGLNPESADSPRIALNDSGAAVVVWENNSDIYAQRYFSDGKPRGAGFRVNSTTTGTQFSPDVAVLPDGGFAVVWQSNDSGNYDIKLRTFSSNGSENLSERIVHAADSDEQSEPSIDVDSDGDLAIAWTDNNYISPGDPDNHDVRAIVYRSTGSTLVTEFMVHAATTDDQSGPSVGMSSDGKFAIAWHSGTDGDSSSLDVKAKLFDSSGGTIAAEFTVNDTLANMQANPDLDMNAGGDFVIAWEGQSQTGGNGLDVYAEVYSELGAEDVDEFRIHTTTGDDQSIASVSLDDDGDFLIAWEGYDTETNYYSVYARRFESDASPLSGERRINASLELDQTSPNLAADDDGNYFLTWVGNSVPLDSNGILGRRFTSNDQPR